MPTKGGLIMSRQYRLATEADADELLSLTLRAYEPIRKLGINFAAATADKELVLTNIQKTPVTFWRKTDGFWRRFLCGCRGAESRAVRCPSYLVVRRRS